MILENETLLQSFIPISVRQQYIKGTENQLGTIRPEGYAALMWIDICRFSALSRKILENPKMGLEKLSLTLHQHYKFLLDLVVPNGGEPVFFAGDGVLCAWFAERDNLNEAIFRSIATAQSVIDANMLQDLDGNPIMLHSFIASGQFQLIEVSDFEGHRLISPIGDALKELSATTKHKAPNKLLISRSVHQRLGKHIDSNKLSDSTYLLEYKDHFTLSKLNNSLPAAPIDPQILKAYVPGSLKNRLDIERLTWIDELRDVTIIFVQLRGFKPESKKAHDVLENVIQIVSEIIYRNEGILGQVWIDEKAANLLVYFGPPPSAHQDNPIRGVKTALEIRNKLVQAGFTNNIGIASGQAFCGLIGNDALRQYTALGDIVNLGARLAEQRVEGVWCDTATMELTLGKIGYNGPFLAKTKWGNIIKSWEPLVGPDLVENFGFETVGRVLELQLLIAEMERVTSGSRGAFILEGASGFGKTKLLQDFTEAVRNEVGKIFITKAERIGQGLPYHAFRSIFFSMLEIDDQLDRSTQEAKVLGILGDELKSHAALLNVVLQQDFPEDDVIAKLSGIQKTSATRTLLLKLLKRKTLQNSIVIIIDDAQWMDENSWLLTAEINRQLDNCFIICALQSADRVPGAKQLLETGATRYQLHELSAKSQDVLIKKVLQSESVPVEINDLVKKIAKGNPFFCIELTQALIDEEVVIIENGQCQLARGAILDIPKLPQTIKGAVRKRIDLLEPGPEMALKVASVAGFNFSTNVVQNIYPIQSEREKVSEYLERDSRLGLIVPELSYDLVGYEFNHSITWEVSYEALLRQQREFLHNKTATWIEETFSSNLIPHFAKLADHWEHAGEIFKSVDYLEKEAIRLFGSGYARQATEIGLRAVDLLGVKIDTDPDKIAPAIGQKLASVGSLLGNRHPSELISHKKLTDEKIEKVTWLLLAVGPFAFQSQQIELFALISVTALELSLKFGHGPPSADVYSMYSPVHRALTGERIQAYQWSQLALELDKKHGEKLHSRVAFVHTWFHHHWQKPLVSSLSISLNAAEAGFSCGDILFACFNLSAHVVYQAVLGTPLEEIMSTAKDFIERNSGRVMNAAFHLIHELQVAKALAGQTEGPLVLSDNEYNEQKDIAYICNTELGNQIGYYLVSKIKLHLHFGDWEGALEWSDKTRPLLAAFEGQVAEIEYVQFKTMAMLLGSGTRPVNAQLTKEIHEGIKTMKSWSEMCPENFQHKAMLLEGLQMGVNGAIDEGIVLLERAATTAGQSGYLNDAGLAWEYTAYLQRLGSTKITALEHAIGTYKRWGANAKIDFLKEKYSFS